MKIDVRLDYVLEQERKYPDRYKQIHEKCCKGCPTDENKKQGIIDPESAQIKMLPKEEIVQEYLFVCAWRTNKLCKGLCDFMEIDEAFIKQTIKS